MFSNNLYGNIFFMQWNKKCLQSVKTICKEWILNVKNKDRQTRLLFPNLKKVLVHTNILFSYPEMLVASFELLFSTCELWLRINSNHVGGSSTKRTELEGFSLVSLKWCCDDFRSQGSKSEHREKYESGLHSAII